MSQKGGYETVLVSACFRCSLMGECDKYLEFYMSKESIGAAEFGFGQPCTAQGQFKSCKGAKISPWLQPGDNIPTFSGHWSPDPSPGSGSWEPDYHSSWSFFSDSNCLKCESRRGSSSTTVSSPWSTPTILSGFLHSRSKYSRGDFDKIRMNLFVPLWFCLFVLVLGLCALSSFLRKTFLCSCLFQWELSNLHDLKEWFCFQKRASSGPLGNRHTVKKHEKKRHNRLPNARKSLRQSTIVEEKLSFVSWIQQKNIIVTHRQSMPRSSST